MTDLKTQRAIETLNAMRETHCCLRITPEKRDGAYLFALLKAYGWTWTGETWEPFLAEFAEV